MKKRILSLLCVFCMMLSLLPVTAFAWTAPSSISVTKATYHSSGALAGIEASFYWSTGSAPGRLVLMTKKLNTTTSSEPEYGDFTDQGTYASSFANFAAVQSYDTANGTFGIISSSEETETTISTTNTKSISFGVGDIPLDKNQLYYVYLWTQYRNNCYPDTLICAIQVHDGAVQYASATSRNSYDDSAFQKVINESVSYGVTVTPATNMTKTSGEETQTGLKGAMEPVIYTANTGYEFPDTYEVTTVNGIMVRRDSATQITVLGTPTADAAITLTAPTLTGTSYAYAYDAQRSPAFPDSVGAEITANSFNPPLKFGAVQNGTSEKYASSYGPWILTEVGYYGDKSSFSPVPTTYLDGVVSTVATKYGINNTEGKNGLVIHKLTDAIGDLVGYGVVIAVDETNGYALFVGDLWNESGAGYLLSKTEITANSVTFNAQQMAQSKYSVSLSPAAVTFDAAEVGYTAPDAQTITVTNTGNDATGTLSVTLSGTNASSFTLSKSSITDIAVSGSDSFTVVPNTGLATGTYTATITVKGEKVMPETVTVSFTVAAPTYTVDITAGANMTLTSGTANQMSLSGAMTDVVYTATNGYYFPENYASIGTANGITVTRTNDSQITVSGTPTANVTLALEAASPNTYTVTLNANGGTVNSGNVTSYTHGTGVALPSDVTKANHTFAGWFDNAGLTGDAVTSIGTTETDAKEFWAKWTPDTYDVTLNTNGGTIAAGKDVTTYTYGVGATLPVAADMTKTGYTFGGWFDNAGLTGTAVTAIGTTEAGNKEYWAKWTADTYTVTLDARGGTIADGKNVTGYTYGVGATLPVASDMTKTGYAFDGWFDNAELTGTAVTAIGTTETGNKTFYAKWTADTYTVTLDARGGTGAPSSITVTYDGTYSNLVNPTRPSYTFAGWFTAAEGGTKVTNSTTVSITGPQTLYARWTLSNDAELENVNFTHAYDVQRNPAFPAKGNNIRLSSYKYPLMADGSFGTTNLGDWKLSKAGTYYSIKNTASANLTYVVNSIANNYSNIEADEIVVHELKNGSTHIAYGVVVAYSAADGCAVFLGDTHGTGAGYLLSYGAKSDPADVTATTVPTDFVQALAYRIMLDRTGTYIFTDAVCGYAAQTPVTVTVTNAGKAETGALEVTLSGTDADKFALSSNSIASIAVSGNDSFSVVPNTGLAIGTYTAVVTVGNTNAVPKEFNISFTVAPAVYTVTFDANGGTVTPASDTTAGIGKLSSLPTPTRSGSYSFKGWYTAANGGTQITTDTVFTENTTIFAQWTYTGGSYYPTTYAVVVKDADNGEVSASTTAASKGTTVTIQVAPDKGYTLETLTATDRSGKEIELTKVSDGKYTFKMPASKVTVQATFMEDNTMLNFFVDVPADAYYYDAVLWAAKNGITEGTSATTFSPDMDCTRAQMVTFLWRAVGSPEPTANVCPFTDVDLDSYYGKAVLWAVENGITKGTSVTTFSPDMACSRAQMVTFICRMADGKPVSSIIAFTDVPADAYYAESVQWAVENGITNGTGDNKFSPNATCTRAQMVTFLYRYFEN